MTDSTETGAVPTEDAMAEDPPAVDELAGSEEVAAAEAGGEPTGRWTDGTPDIEGPNSA